MPTQDGQAPGKVSLSGGWTWAIPAKSKNPDAAWNFIKTLQTQKNAAKWDDRRRADRGPQGRRRGPGYTASMPSTKFFTDLVRSPLYRPALPEYPKVSTEISTAMEAVTTGDSSPDEAAKDYDERSKTIADGATVGDRPVSRHGRPWRRPDGPARPGALRPALRWLPLAPAIVLLLVFLAGPIVYCVYIAFTNMPLTGQRPRTEFVGLDNFRKAFGGRRLPQRDLADPGVHAGLRDHRPEHPGPGPRRC